VKRLNLIEEQLAGLDFATAPGFVVNGLKREQLVAMNSMILHEVFFDGLGEESEPGSALANALARDFGSFERWCAEFTAMGKALGGGSGWVLLTWSPRDGRLVNQWAADHTTTLAGGRPILALDMYEHSYHIDFGAKAATYVDTFMQAIRWATADRLYAWLKQAWDETQGWPPQAMAHTDAEVNDASEESFPASDPPSFTPVSGAGRPERQ
jgi:Fe-Mn family superoxide dismutase